MEPNIQYTSRHSILLVEDDPVSRKNLGILIQNKLPGIKLLLAENGETGLNLCKEYTPQIVITDINLPMINGIRMAGEILSHSPSTKIIVITAHNNMQYLLDCINIGISRYVLKPIEYSLLFEAIEDCIARIELETRVKEQNEYIRKLSMVVEQSPSMIMITDADGIIEYVNPMFSELTGYTPEEVIGQNPRILRTSKTPPEVHKDLWSTINSGLAWRGELLNSKKNGDLYWEAASIFPLFNGKNKITHFIAVKDDITRHKQIEKELQESEKRYRSLFENMLEGFAYCKMLFDDNGLPVDFVYLDVNNAFVNITGADNVVGKKVTEVFPGIRELHPELFEIYNRVASTGKIEKFDLEFKPAAIWLSVSVYSPEKDYFVAIFDDITDRKHYEIELSESEKRYKELSITDAMTQLFNSRHFFNQLKFEAERANRYKHPLSLILLDIDDFKRYNDTYGHLEGDKVLAVLAASMKKNLRSIDSAYRYGGEEFTVLLPETGLENALLIAERIRLDFSLSVLSPLPESEVRMTVSIGAGQYIFNEIDSSFIERVDKAMYHAKKLGKNQVCRAI